MQHRALTIDQALNLLAETPRHIEALTAALPVLQLHAPPNQGEWSANNVLAHLRGCTEVWGKCIVEIATREKPVIRAINPRTWIQKTDYQQQEFRISLPAFTAQRADLITFLESLAPENWSRTETITGAGKSLQRTIHFYAEWLATYERTHVKQIHRIVSALSNR